MLCGVERTLCMFIFYNITADELCICSKDATKLLARISMPKHPRVPHIVYKTYRHFATRIL